MYGNLLHPKCVKKPSVINKERYNFIYPSFPNRGLLQLLKMWPLIIQKYPEAKLNLFCDTQNTWVQKFWSNDMIIINELIVQYTSPELDEAPQMTRVW